MSISKSAFPLHPGVDPSWDISNGMTLRDWFAGQALAGMCSNAALLDGAGTLTQIHAQEAWVTELSFALADRMLAERSKA